MLTNSRNISPIHTVIRSSSPCKHATQPLLGQLRRGTSMEPMFSPISMNLLQGQYQPKGGTGLTCPGRKAIPAGLGGSSAWGREGKGNWSNFALLHRQRCLLCFCGLSQLNRAGAQRPEARVSLQVTLGPSLVAGLPQANAASHKLTGSVYEQMGRGGV